VRGMAACHFILAADTKPPQATTTPRGGMVRRPAGPLAVHTQYSAFSPLAGIEVGTPGVPA
jgi:hypothetical protein